MNRRITLPGLLFFLLFLWACGPFANVKKARQAEDYPRAISLLEKMVASDSGNAEAWYLLGDSYLKHGQVAKAATALDQSLALRPGHAATRAAAVSAHVREGAAQAEQDHYNTAISHFAKAEKLDSTAFGVYFERGKYYKKLSFLEKAQNDFERAAAISSTDPRADEALAELQKAESKRKVHFDKGLAAYKKRRWITATRELEKALAINKDHKETRYFANMAKGRRLFKKGSVTALWDAIEAFGYAMNLRPENPDAYYFMGQSYQKKDKADFDGPIEWYSKVIAMAPDSKMAKDSKKRIAKLKKTKAVREKFFGGKKKN